MNRKISPPTVVYLVLLFVIITESPSMAQNAPQEFGPQYLQSARELNYITQDLLQIAKSLSFKQSCILSDAISAMSDTASMLFNDGNLLSLSPMIKEEAEAYFLSKLALQLSVSKQRLELSIKQLQSSYGGVRNQAALHLLDKAKTIMRSSEELYTKCLGVMLSAQKTKR